MCLLPGRMHVGEDIPGFDLFACLPGSQACEITEDVAGLNGEYFWRRSMVEQAALPAFDVAQYKAALPPSAERRVLVATGRHGALALRDAELPVFQVILVSGEIIAVCIEAVAS